MLRWAAKPMMMLAMPAEASMLAPNCRTGSKTISIDARGEDDDHRRSDLLQRHLGRN